MQNGQGQRTGKKLGLMGCGCGITFIGLLGTFLYIMIFTNVCARMMGTETYPFKSDTKHLDPFAAIEEVRAKVGTGARLVEVEADFVRSDGTMDLTATYKPAPRITYKFIVPLDKAPADAPPVGAGRGPDDVWTQQVTVNCYEPGQRRHITRISGGSRTSYNYTNEGMEIDRSTPSMGSLKSDIGAPKITTAELWKMALGKGANKAAVARIEFTDDGYEFSITGTPVRFECGPDGKLKP